MRTWPPETTKHAGRGVAPRRREPGLVEPVVRGPVDAAGGGERDGTVGGVVGPGGHRCFQLPRWNGYFGGRFSGTWAGTHGGGGFRAGCAGAVRCFQCAPGRRRSGPHRVVRTHAPVLRQVAPQVGGGLDALEEQVESRPSRWGRASRRRGRRCPGRARGRRGRPGGRRPGREPPSRVKRTRLLEGSAHGAYDGLQGGVVERGQARAGGAPEGDLVPDAGRERWPRPSRGRSSRCGPGPGRRPAGRTASPWREAGMIVLLPGPW